MKIDNCTLHELIDNYYLSRHGFRINSCESTVRITYYVISHDFDMVRIVFKYIGPVVCGGWMVDGGSYRVDAVVMREDIRRYKLHDILKND